MNATGAKPFTADDYRRMEEDEHRYEVLEGELCMAPAPNRFHQAISRNLCRMIYTHLHTHPIGKAYNAPFDVYFDDLNVAQPDVVFVKNSTKAKLVDEGIHGAPDLLVEVLSPSTSTRDLGVKRALYAKSGVEEYWIISPELRQMQVYRLQDNPERPTNILLETDTHESPLLGNLQIPVAELFVD